MPENKDIQVKIVGPGHCHNCGVKIKTMCFRGEIYCSDDCRKALGKDIK